MAVATSSLSTRLCGEASGHHPIEEGLLELLEQLALAGELISREVARAALTGGLGTTRDKNPSGDSQKKLDVIADEICLRVLSECRFVAAIVGEEHDEPVLAPDGKNGPYVVYIDPLDGSSNTDINGSLGTIFGIYRRRAGSTADNEFLRRGSEQIAAGYILYGTSTMFVYSAGRGVQGCTLDRDSDEFVLSHPDMRCPRQGNTYSANLGRYSEWERGIRRLSDALNAADPIHHRSYSLRYTGALVADFHRCLLEGGFYFYPADRSYPEGKLRLLYECAPLALIIEDAGGAAGTGAGRVLDIEARSIHQRSPLVIGSAEDVARYEAQIDD